MVYVVNAFSLNMLDLSKKLKVIIKPIKIEKIKDILDKNEYKSAIGHKDLVNIIYSEFGLEFEANRVSLKLNKKDSLIVFQYIGSRLAEGTTKLPENSTIKTYKITESSVCFRFKRIFKEFLEKIKNLEVKL